MRRARPSLRNVSLRAAVAAVMMVAVGTALYLTMGVSAWSAVLFALACGGIASLMRA